VQASETHLLKQKANNRKKTMIEASCNSSQIKRSFLLLYKPKRASPRLSTTRCSKSKAHSHGQQWQICGKGGKSEAHSHSLLFLCKTKACLG